MLTSNDSRKVKVKKKYLAIISKLSYKLSFLSLFELLSDYITLISKVVFLSRLTTNTYS